ncbi:ADP-ribosylglycohydrolase family protein [Streptomyces sp. KL118A]|uniref:ADP-ribosylglycohydrolase family protein n=1 Tax=Streptomyces sp. KL118A TaxID=3045153 RepID=UPI00278C76EB|nr:ADP-ribosylglycohydrolase family protein [Streptomyces sp. KL118A]
MSDTPAPTPGPRFVPRKHINPRFEDDMAFSYVSGPAEYAHESAGPVDYLAVADERGTVTTYVWANDQDDAAGWIVRRDARTAGNTAVNDGRWMRRLRDGKERGIAPTAVLHELVRDVPAVVPGSLTTAPGLAGLYDLADQPFRRPVWRSSRAALLGLAIGDAMGRPLSLLPMDRITALYGGWESMELPLAADGTVRVSDQTQLTLAVGEALAEVAVQAPLPEAEARLALTVRGALPAPPWLTPGAVTTALRTHLINWRRSPDNDRSPGRTTLDACTALMTPAPWQQASAVGSKGCAAVVRAAAVGLAPHLTPDQRSAIAQLQAALTHGHPTALAASDLAAHAVDLLGHRCAPSDLLPLLRTHAETSRSTYRADWLGDLAARAGASNPAEFIAAGWDECLAALSAMESAVRAGDPHHEPGRAVGASWTADAVLAGALYAFLTTDRHPRNALRRAAHTSGASAATAALTGALAGACRGPSGWPPEWVEAVEYGERLGALGGAWDRA